MTTMKRRAFLATAGATAASAALTSAFPRAQTAVRPGRDLPSGRPAGKVEIVFKAPGPKSNGLQATDEGLWIMDQGNNHAYLVTYDGKVLRDFETEADRASGITFDGEALWLASTYSREIIRCDAHTGKTIRKYYTPGAGVIYSMPTDVPGRRSPLLPPPDPDRLKEARSRRREGRQVGAPRDGTGAHGLEWRDDRLWVAVPPSRTIYRINPETWQVEHTMPTVERRPHGIGFEGDYLWETDSNLNAFFKRDPETGAVLDRIQLADTDPLPHGMTIRDGFIWYCDDIPNAPVCRVRIAAGGAPSSGE